MYARNLLFSILLFSFDIDCLPFFQDILQRGSVQQLVLHVLHARDQGQVSPTDQADLHSYRRKSLRMLSYWASGCQEDVLKKLLSQNRIYENDGCV